MTRQEKEIMVEHLETLQEKNTKLAHDKIDAEIRAEKAEAQMKIARTALVAMVSLMAFLVSPWAPSIEMLNALDSSLSTFFIAMASVVGAYMGFAAWMSRK